MDDLWTDRCNRIEADESFAVSRDELLRHSPSSLLNWPDAEVVFSRLDEELQTVLKRLAQGKDILKSADTDAAFECLVLLKILSPNFEFKKKKFAEWIRLHHTNRGRLSKPIRRVVHGERLRDARNASAHPGWLVLGAIVSIGLPIVLMLIPLLNLTMPPWVMQLFGDDQQVDSYREFGILLVMLTVAAYLFFWLTRHSMVNELKLILGVGAISLMFLWLGFPVHLVILFAVVSFFDLLALYFLYKAHKRLSTMADKTETHSQLRGIVGDIVNANDWKDPRKWSESRLLLIIVLTLTGLLFFSFLVTPREYSLVGPNTNKLVLVPSWLSYRDEGTIVMATHTTTTTLVSGTVLLEPELGNLIHVVPSNEDVCTPHCQWGPLSLAADSSLGTISTASNAQPSVSSLTSAYELLEWKLRTAPRSVFSIEPKWRLRVQTCEETEGMTMSCEPSQTISINRIRIGFRLWGFLEEQPLVNVLSIVFGLVYAMVQIWVSNLLIFKNGASATKSEPL